MLESELTDLRPDVSNEDLSFLSIPKISIAVNDLPVSPPFS